ncbi:MAG: hypothetical protein ACK5JT_12920 [Hyphomicrobiaceae bacterium]
MTETVTNTGTNKDDAEAAARTVRRRSIAIALMLAALVVLFYCATLVRFGDALSGKVG